MWENVKSLWRSTVSASIRCRKFLIFKLSQFLRQMSPIFFLVSLIKAKNETNMSISHQKLSGKLCERATKWKSEKKELVSH